MLYRQIVIIGLKGLLRGNRLQYFYINKIKDYERG